MIKFDDGLFASRIKELISKAGSAPKLADQSGTSDRTIQKWSQGVSVPKLDTVADFAFYYDVSLDWLAYGRDGSSSFSKPEVVHQALWSVLDPLIAVDVITVPEDFEREKLSQYLIKHLEEAHAEAVSKQQEVQTPKPDEKTEVEKPEPAKLTAPDSQIIIHEHDKAVEITEIIDTKPAKKKRKKLHGLAEIPEGFMAPAIISQLPPVPILGCAAGSAVGSMAISPDALDQADRPVGLKDEEDAYALFVQGESMAPRYVTGDLVYVSPHRAFKQDDYVIIQTQYYEGAEILSYVKQFIRHTDDSIVTRQFNPAGEIEFKNQIVIAVHRVMQLHELQGKRSAE